MEIHRPQPEEAVTRTHVTMTIVVNLEGYRTASGRSESKFLDWGNEGMQTYPEQCVIFNIVGEIKDEVGRPQCSLLPDCDCSPSHILLTMMERTLKR